MNIKQCSICSAQWIDGQHYWTGTNKKGNEKDLAGLVCNNLLKRGEYEKFDQCTNPCKGKEGGQTWESRRLFSDTFDDKINVNKNNT